VAAGAALLAIGAGRMWAAGVQWLPAWQEQVRQFQLVGDGNPTLSNHVRSQLINLQYPIHSVIESRVVVNALVYGILGALCLAYFVVDWRRGRARGVGRGEIVSLAMVAVVTLLVAYHRFYDAAVLVFPLAAAVRVLSEAGNGARARRAAWGVVVLLGLFVVPITGQLLVLELHGWTVAGRHFELPPGVAKSLVWNFVVMPHEVWALLAMAVLMVVMRGAVRQEH
jgi:hypothetical protein